MRIRPPLVAEENMEKRARKAKRKEERRSEESASRSPTAEERGQILCIPPTLGRLSSLLTSHSSWSLPAVVRAIHIRKRELRIDLHRADRRRTRDAGGLRAGAGEPWIDGKLEPLYAPVSPCDREAHRHRRKPAIFDRHDERVTIGGRTAYRLIEGPGLEPPGSPEPVEVAPGHVLEGVPEVEGRRMLVDPSASVLAVRTKEQVVAEESPKRTEVDRHLVVAGDAERGRSHRVEVAMAHELHLAAIARQVQIVLA